MGFAAIEFVILSGVIVSAGFFLTKFADRLAEQLGWGQSLGGLLLLATATSLPELSVNSQAAFVGAADLAVGSTVGSSLYNLLILGLLDLGRKPNGRMLSPLAASHGLSAASSIIVTGLACLFIASPIPIGVGRFGFGPLVVAIAYWLAIRMIFFDQKYASLTDPKPKSPVRPDARIGKIVAPYLLATFVVFVAAASLVPVAERIAKETGLGQTFVGTVLVALASSLPEIVTTVTAVRMGATSLAVGNIFGSNAFNMVTLLPAELVYRGNLLADASTAHALTGMCVVIVTSVATAGLLYRPDRLRGLEPDAKAIVGLVFLSFCFLFFVR